MFRVMFRVTFRVTFRVMFRAVFRAVRRATFRVTLGVTLVVTLGQTGSAKPRLGPKIPTVNKKGLCCREAGGSPVAHGSENPLGGLAVPVRGATGMVGYCESPTMIVWRHIGFD